MKRKNLIITLAASFLLGLAACKGKSVTASKPHGPQATTVTIATVTNAAWDKTVSIVGTLYPKDSATIGAQVEGQVEKTLVDFGDRVKAGQDLAYIDTASYEALLQQAEGNVSKAQANYKNAQQNFDRMEALRKQGVASESDYDAARAQDSQWEAELKAAQGTEAVARLNVQRSRVQAPFDGGISQRLVARGDFLKVGSPLFEIVSDSVLKFIFQVPEKYASSVQKKLPVNFTVDNYPGQTFTGSVYLISPQITSTSRAFNVGALVTNTDFRLKANTFGRGSLTLEKAVPTPVVPVEAVVNFAGVTKVFVLEKENVARSRTVETGRARDGLQEIVSGLKSGETVITSGNTKLADGSAVIVRSEAEAPQPLVAQGKVDHERR